MEPGELRLCGKEDSVQKREPAKRFHVPQEINSIGFMFGEPNPRPCNDSSTREMPSVIEESLFLWFNLLAQGSRRFAGIILYLILVQIHLSLQDWLVHNILAKCLLLSRHQLRIQCQLCRRSFI